jgi:AIR synthase-related protein
MTKELAKRLCTQGIRPMLLSKLLNELKHYSGITQKADIQPVAEILAQGFRCDSHPNGDDTAVIETNNGFDLLATEGFLTQFVEHDPWFAGWCGLMVNISDIASMGGRPTAVVNALWGSGDQRCLQIIQGLVDASNVYKVPIVGGHTNLQSTDNQLSVSILGRAKKILSSFAAEPGHDLVVVIDLRGEYRPPFLNWNASTTSPPQRLREDLELLPYVAENNLAKAAKDISQAGILGTALMLLESSEVGADIALERIPKPNNVSWHDWLRSFPSFGYLFTCPQQETQQLIRTFENRDISASHIGSIKHKRSLDVSYYEQQATFWDLNTQALTGMLATNNSVTKTMKSKASIS